MAGNKLTLYYDIGSPFAYYAYHVVTTSPVFRDTELTFIPVLLGGIFKACGNRAPIEIKNKDKWGDLERKRWAKIYDIPVADHVPEGFPISTLLIQRALTALVLYDLKELIPVTDAIYKAFWVEANARKINEADGLGALLGEVLGNDKARKTMEKSTSNEVKKALGEATEKALTDGAFGLPYWIATNAKNEAEPYWGFDRLGQIVDHLGIERPQTTSKGWRVML